LGVHLLAGTDAPNPECFYGVSLHWELRRLVEAGVSPLKAIQMATADAAGVVGAKNLGEIRTGYLAALSCSMLIL
jgi:imidazolonepropionase-like amidohydrolase